MKDILLFHYKDNNTPLHSWDPRSKIISLILMALLIMNSNLNGLIIIIFIITLVLIISKISIKTLFYETSSFAFFILLIILLKSISFSPEKSSDLHFSFLYFNIGNFKDALIFGIKLLSIIYISTIFIQTSSLNKIRATIIYYFKWLPFLPERIIANICCLAINSIPIISEEFLNLSEAHKARCINSNKNFMRRINIFLKTFSINTLNKTENISEAMDSRCFNYKQRTEIKLKHSFRDLGKFIISLILMSAVYYINIVF